MRNINRMDDQCHIYVCFIDWPAILKYYWAFGRIEIHLRYDTICERHSNNPLIINGERDFNLINYIYSQYKEFSVFLIKNNISTLN
jgi:hypothetical protein